MPPPKSRGRPRAFETDKALDAALAVFWRHGYEGTSIAALSRAMGINAPSLYAAFGNKQALFAKVVDRYIEKPASYLRKACEQPTARDVAEKAMSGAIDMVSRPGSGDGCLMVHGALASGPATESVRVALGRRRAGAESFVRHRFERAKAQGDLPASADADQLARYLMTVIWGLSVQAAGGATRPQLLRVATVALHAWPR